MSASTTHTNTHTHTHSRTSAKTMSPQEMLQMENIRGSIAKRAVFWGLCVYVCV
jgi:hypothetical protein